MSENKALLDGKYLMCKGKPLVREKNVIVYGDMKDKYYLFLMILTEKTLDDGKKVPDSILIQVLDTDGKIIKQVAGTALAAGKHIDNGKAFGIGQGFQKAGQVLVAVIHLQPPTYRIFSI